LCCHALFIRLPGWLGKKKKTSGGGKELDGSGNKGGQTLDVVHELGSLLSLTVYIGKTEAEFLTWNTPNKGLLVDT
jgi:hypothetical protein